MTELLPQRHVLTVEFTRPRALICRRRTPATNFRIVPLRARRFFVEKAGGFHSVMVDALFERGRREVHSFFLKISRKDLADMVAFLVLKGG